MTLSTNGEVKVNFEKRGTNVPAQKTVPPMPTLQKESNGTNNGNSNGKAGR